ncbi:MAG: hypothetical protein PHD86_08265, partial [Kiritimatiellae bacterium]|nr:hypothetical protein [Kiritimatiellia bacterium]
MAKNGQKTLKNAQKRPKTSKNAPKTVFLTLPNGKSTIILYYDKSGNISRRHEDEIRRWFMKFNRLLLAAAAMLTACAAGAKADDLRDYLAAAARNNPELEAAFNRWKAELERIPQVRALPDPRFNYAYFVEEVETRVGPQKQRLGLSQVFPWFGTLKLR